ncbi:hypothetical protein [Saccharospirillum salsuginis]|uniref:Fluoroquinolone transport system permease protein n=1 Tax=Saccharospirillum salsuginis TaxID=418750 RepID=A0A918KLZ4_9GAMM|nr:hypothetical protein [Saccharospirillum salsuginis]GGX68291.1 hypothetical protein GCM10007392_39820 [Saccharospirillum salsuginis]
MTAWLALLNAEARLFWRQGLVAAALVLTLVWVALLHLTPPADRLFWLGLVAGMDVIAMGLLFGFGLGLLDQVQGTPTAWRLTPTPALWFSLSRTLLLSGLLTACLLLLAFLVLPFATVWPRLPGLVLLAIQAALAGQLFGRWLSDLNGFILATALSAPLWALPFLGYAGWLDGPLPWLWPLSGGLYWLTEGALSSPVSLAWITGLQLGWILVSAGLVERLAPRHLGHRLGERS